MPESQNVDLVRRGFEAFLRGGFDAALETVSPNLVAVRQAPLPDPQVYHGPDGLRQMWSDWTTDFDRFEMEVDQIDEVRGRVIVEVVQRGTGRTSGVEVEGRFWFLCAVDDGKVSRLDGFASREQAVEAVRRT